MNIQDSVVNYDKILKYKFDDCNIIIGAIILDKLLANKLKSILIKDEETNTKNVLDLDYLATGSELERKIYRSIELCNNLYLYARETMNYERRIKIVLLDYLCNRLTPYFESIDHVLEEMELEVDNQEE